MPVDAASRTQWHFLEGVMVPCMSATASGLSDEDLVGWIRTGDRAAYDRAWDVLYERWFPRMRSLCFLAIGAEHADDVAQDILVKCARGIRTFRGRSSFSTWLHRIASNCIADKIRELVKARKREAVSDKDVEELLDSKVERESGAREPATDREVRELVECCRDTLAGLPRETLAVIAPAARGEDVQADRRGARPEREHGDGTLLQSGGTGGKEHAGRRSGRDAAMTREVADRCPEEEGFVARYACGGCDDDEQRRFAAHLASCEACAAKLRSVRMIVETLESWEPPPLEERLRRAVPRGVPEGRSTPRMDDRGGMPW